LFQTFKKKNAGIFGASLTALYLSDLKTMTSQTFGVHV